MLPTEDNLMTHSLNFFAIYSATLSQAKVEEKKISENVKQQNVNNSSNFGNATVIRTNK